MLYESEAFRAYLYHCTATPHCHVGEEAAAADEYAFPLKGLFVRHSSRANDVADPTKVLFFRKDEPYEIHHPVDGGDTSLVVQRKEQTTPEFAASTAGSALLDPVDWQRVVALADALSSRESPTPLMIDEQLWLLTGRFHPSSHDARSINPTAVKSQEGVRQKIVEHACVFMNREYRNEITVGDIAKHAGSSEFRLCRLFKERTGVSLHAYMQRLRIRQSLDLLRQTNRPIVDIAIELGFSSHSHFGAAFLKFVGSTPSDYRREFRTVTIT